LSHTPHHTKSPLGSRGRDKLSPQFIAKLYSERIIKIGEYKISQK